MRTKKPIHQKPIGEGNAQHVYRKILTSRAEAQVRLQAPHARFGATRLVRRVVLLVMSIYLPIGLASEVYAQTVPRDPTPTPVQIAPTEAKSMTAHASGTFDVKLSPQKPDNKEAESANIGRMSLDKQFHGDIEALSKGEMLGVRNEKQGSGGYVAMERVSGTLHGRKGTFVLQHSGTMNGGSQQMTITVVPDSATDHLAGLSGKMIIKIENGKHFYEFEYTLPEAL